MTGRVKTKVRPRAAAKPTTIDAYLARLSPDKRAALERLRKLIRAAVPRAEECIAYDMPSFRLDGQWLVGIAAAAKHCAIYGVTVDAAVAARYDTSGRGTLRFQPDDPLPAALVRKLIKARQARL
jgi:uncharacterized protein YdhG (YjbR/CyaY superfamily)